MRVKKEFEMFGTYNLMDATIGHLESKSEDHEKAEEGKKYMEESKFEERFFFLFETFVKKLDTPIIRESLGKDLFSSLLRSIRQLKGKRGKKNEESGGVSNSGVNFSPVPSTLLPSLSPFTTLLASHSPQTSFSSSTPLFPFFQHKKLPPKEIARIIQIESNGTLTPDQSTPLFSLPNSYRLLWYVSSFKSNDQSSINKLFWLFFSRRMDLL